MKIKFKSLQIGDDYLIIITGGDAHIGAISLYEKNSFLTIKKVSHMDDVVTKMVAKKIYKKLNKDVTVLCGIHFDNITKNKISKIIKKTKKETKKWIKEQN